MESNDPETFVSSYEEGVRRVLRGNYAFLCESTMLDFLLQRNCNLTRVGGLLDNKVNYTSLSFFEYSYWPFVYILHPVWFQFQ